jgi:hypothetical protein
MKQKMLKERNPNPKPESIDPVPEVKDYELTEEIKTEEMMYSENESHESSSSSDSNSSIDNS